MNTFLDTVWGTMDEATFGLFGELRIIRRDGEVRQFFEPLTDEGVSTLVRIAEVNNRIGWDVYYGVLPRVRPRGRSEDCVATTAVLWADIDAKHFSDELAVGKRISLDVLSDISPYPSIVVDSGGGMHAYWLLRRSVALTEAASAMRGLARQTGGDAVHDAARVLRLPGTVNWKRERPAVSRILRFQPRPAFGISDFDTYMFTRDYPPASAGGVIPRTDELPVWLTDLIAYGAPAGQRSEAVFRAVYHLLRRGRSEDEVRSIIRTNPIGEKYREMNPVAGERWLNRTIKRARALV